MVFKSIKGLAISKFREFKTVLVEWGLVLINCKPLTYLAQ